jgi:hypothetical protein
MRVPCEALNLHGLATAMRAVGDLTASGQQRAA